MYFVLVVIKLIRNTHRHPVNQVLHFVGAPFYVLGLALIIGYFAAIETNLFAGVTMWLAGVALFLSGHKIEGNMGSMTPLLLFRLLSKIARNSVEQRV